MLFLLLLISPSSCIFIGGGNESLYCFILWVIGNDEWWWLIGGAAQHRMTGWEQINKRWVTLVGVVCGVVVQCQNLIFYGLQNRNTKRNWWTQKFDTPQFTHKPNWRYEKKPKWDDCYLQSTLFLAHNKTMSAVKYFICWNCIEIDWANRWMD